MRQAIVSLFFFLVICCVSSQSYPVPLVPQNISGTAGDNSIWYQTGNYINFGNVRNPVTVWLNYTDTSNNFPASVCLNSYAQERPIPGTHLSAVCPSGALAVLSNNDPLGEESEFEDHPSGTVRNTQTAELYVQPGYGTAGFVVSIPDSVKVDDDDDDSTNYLQNFILGYSGEYCEDSDLYPVGSNGQCTQIPLITDLDTPSSTTMVLYSQQWYYAIYDFSSYSPNKATFMVNGTHDGIEIFLQDGYYPTDGWYLETETETDDDDHTMTLSSLIPSTRLFVGIKNSGDEAQTVNFIYNITVCDDDYFGKDCSHHTNFTSDPIKGYLEFSASLNTSLTMPTTSNLPQLATVNSGEKIIFEYENDKDDDDTYTDDYAYIKLVNLPDPSDPSMNETESSGVTSFPYFIRVTVANTDIASLSAAPGLFASWGNFPSESSNDYNISTIGDVTHQLVLPITKQAFEDYQDNADNTWYIAVKLPVSFPIWIGTNCAECVNGGCYCNDGYCSVANELSYRFPSTLVDSSGSCTCDNSAYRYSFDCSEKNNGNSVAYICIIGIGGLIILFVAIGVPVYCFFANKKKADGYETLD